MDQMLARGRRSHIPVAALILDLDDFKDINNTLGHSTGDQLLKAVGTRLAGALRQEDTVGRVGGDEFIVLVEGASLAAGPEVVAARLLDILATPFHISRSKLPLSVTASIGIAVGLPTTPDELLQNADIALYRAKAAGKHCSVMFASAMQFAIDVHRSLELDLHRGFEADRLILELTETTLMHDVDGTAARLEQLRGLGVRLAIDDFGTGYSSLSYLRQFPIDILKIDRSFISGGPATIESEALVHTLVQLGKLLGLEIVAEGIETEDQRTRLKAEDVDTGQGFLFAPPLDILAIDSILQDALLVK
jgi:diguanylate cyclase (GGDEF)-like protein